MSATSSKKKKMPSAIPTHWPVCDLLFVAGGVGVGVDDDSPGSSEYASVGKYREGRLVYDGSGTGVIGASTFEPQAISKMRLSDEGAITKL